MSADDDAPVTLTLAVLRASFELSDDGGYGFEGDLSLPRW